jgi:hypothetical protein
MPTLLYIDDQTCASRLSVQKLRSSGYEVQVALDADEAVGLFRLYEVDAVVMNCHCGEKSREAAASTFRRISRDSNCDALILLPCPVHAVQIGRRVHPKRRLEPATWCTPNYALRSHFRTCAIAGCINSVTRITAGCEKSCRATPKVQ